MKIVRYLKARLNEKSTYASIVAAVSGAAMLSSPRSYLAVAAGILGALAPSTKPEAE